MTVPQAFNLALEHHRAGRLAEAEAIYREILTVQPHHGEAAQMLGVIAHQTRREPLALEWLSRALVLDPNNAGAHSNLGEVYRAMGRDAEAISCYRRALQLNPNFAEAYNNLGVATWSLGQFGEAIAACRHALRLEPNYPEAYYNLGNALRDRGQSEDAIAAYHRALALWPDCWKTLNNLGNAFWDQGRVDEAVASYRRALQGGPEDPGIGSNLIMALNYLPGATPETIAAEQRGWNRRLLIPERSSMQPHRNDQNPARRLKIGYVSPDLWDHVAGRNLIPLFRHHDHENFAIVCYSGVVRPDSLTEEFRRHSDEWISTVHLDDNALVRAIDGQSIDILVDLSQHMGGNRLPVFARQPAPLQVSFGGYPESTGIEAIRHRISDRWLEPEVDQDATEWPVDTSTRSDSDLRTRERVWRIDSFWCYDPCGVNVGVNGLPAQANGRVTFGSLNTFRKINKVVLRLWAQILAQVPGSRLVLLSAEGSHRRRPLEILAEAGIEPTRVDFIPPRPRAEYLKLYHGVDVILDPFPYNGHTTSLDALWMGVPVVTFAGPTAVSRGGLSILSNVGLPELVARSEEGYVRIAVDLALDLPRLADLRQSLRARMENSVLMDAAHFACQIESVYRAIWRRWCSEAKEA